MTPTLPVFKFKCWIFILRNIEKNIEQKHGKMDDLITATTSVPKIFSSEPWASVSEWVSGSLTHEGRKFDRGCSFSLTKTKKWRKSREWAANEPWDRQTFYANLLRFALFRINANSQMRIWTPATTVQNIIVANNKSTVFAWLSHFSANRRFASKHFQLWFLPRIFASRFYIRFIYNESKNNLPKMEK
jgi:hypothetical protein